MVVVATIVTALLALTVSGWIRPALAAAADTPDEMRCLALNIYFEAAGGNETDQRAVAHVTVNRVRDPQYPDTVCNVISQKTGGGCQFSWMCDGRSDQPKDEGKWAQAQKVAREVLEGRTRDPSRGATHFHRDDVTPDWADDKEKTAEIGRHEFYK